MFTWLLHQLLTRCNVGIHWKGGDPMSKSSDCSGSKFLSEVAEA